MKEIKKVITLGDMNAVYLYDTEKNVLGMQIIPKIKSPLFTLDGNWNIEPLVQVKIIGDRYADGFSHGHTMRNSVSSRELIFVKQQEILNNNRYEMITYLQKDALQAIHHLVYRKDTSYIKIYTELVNVGEQPLGIEMVSSFSLCGYSSMEETERMGDLVLHRMRSKWSGEGRLISENLLDLQLEPSWMRSGVNSERFGQVGSMPVRKFFPWMILEDKKYGYSVGVQLYHPASWQMEVYNRDDRIALSGGLADREFGHWYKYLKPGEGFVTPAAVVATACEDVDGISHRLVSAQKETLKNIPEAEEELPIVFNEFCTTWGAPSEENIRKILETIKGKGIKYFVIDAGWYAKKIGDWTNIGDWVVNAELFPNGLKPVADAIREAGMIPGIWFELELAGMKSEIFDNDSYLLKRDEYPLQTGCRRFLDMQKPEVIQYLTDRVIGTLKECNFGYLKIDYNDNIGIGCDGEDSLGEGLRKNMEASQTFIRKIKEEIPELVIENCSSGGHRLEPSMQALVSMASFSDAHECKEIPIIAANVQRAVLPRQSQIWAVMRAEDDEKRIFYSIANTFLGRMCLSGDVYNLKPWQWSIIEKGIDFYKECRHLIKEGRSYRLGERVQSYNHPKGSQAVVRVQEKEALCVIHSFEDCEKYLVYNIPVGENWKIKKSFQRDGVTVKSEGTRLMLEGMEEYDSAVVLLSLEEQLID